ncbi:MAG: UDP-N-acetylglucosamine--N-acetylmuramyl-(pentapeptide) pyrophosphoryl-undecaprenol N-acetylglucosamine transferase [Patescibacteria group bacterium]|nr:UDP-N-acetylglucosamine--N-acetylmuramyl-(pentapeptide) pyrophosphoryl-undecaprenol N-acetylglucosamine transferase [Patescibacteria group bacterium]
MKSSYPVIVLSGGHLSPAYAVASFLKKHYSSVVVIFIGRERSFTSKQHSSCSPEKDLMGTVCDHVKILDIKRAHFIRNFFYSVYKIYIILSKYNPSVVVSFGGYVGVAVGIAGLLRRVPIIIHEQTHRLGIGNAILAPFAKKICVSYLDMADGRRIYTGFPLRDEVLHPPSRPSFEIKKGKPILYVTGGSTGAVFLNDLCFSILDELLSRFVVIHQTGMLSFDKAQFLKNNLSSDKKDFYHIHQYIHPSDAAWLLHNSSIIVSRSGANTVYELAVTKTPSVLIPLPISSEQAENAEWLLSYAPTEIIFQRDASRDSMLRAIERVQHKKNIEHNAVQTDGTQRFCNEIISSL